MILLIDGDNKPSWKTLNSNGQNLLVVIKTMIRYYQKFNSTESYTLHQQGKLNPSLLKLKLLDCLRNGDTDKLNQLIQEAKSIRPPDHQVDNLMNQLLHFAVQVSPLSSIEYIAKNKLTDDYNCQDQDGNTALHLACMSSRSDVVNYLMSLPSINDCILNKQLKQAIECCSNMETVQIMSDSRTKFVEIKANELRTGFETRNFAVLEELLSHSRVKNLLDINGTDPVTGDTVLLEFIKKDDVEMVKFILKNGGDPFKRSLNGKLPIDSAMSSSMKRLIKESCNDQTMIDSANQSSGQPQAGPPTFKGFLKKWTNFAGGYKLRWFILDSEGRLSYYKSPNDIYNSCRGMIHLSSAQLKMDSSEKSKFEIIIKNKSGGNPLRWHLKANHVIETNRWVWALQNAIRYTKDIERQKRANVSAKAATSNNHDSDEQLQSSVRSTISPSTARNRESFEANRSSNTLNIASSTDAMVASPLHSHQRTFSQASSVSVSSDEEMSPIQNQQSNTSSQKSTSSKGSLYKRPMKKISRLTRRTKDAFNLPDIKENSGLKLPRGTPINGSLSSGMSSNTSLNSVDSTSNIVTVSSSIENDLKSSDEEDDDDDDDDDLAAASELTKKYAPDSSFNEEDFQESSFNHSDLIVSKNQMKIELNSFAEFLKTAEADGSITKKELIEVSLSILGNIVTLSDKQSELISLKEKRFSKFADRQVEISRIWENSIKQLGLEIELRESKIVELEDKLRGIKRSLRNSITFVKGTSTPTSTPQGVQAPQNDKGLTEEAAAVSDASPIVTPASAMFVSEQAQTESPDEIMKFLEEEDDSDDEFFDAEDDGNGGYEPIGKEEEEVTEILPQSEFAAEPSAVQIKVEQPQEVPVSKFNDTAVPEEAPPATVIPSITTTLDSETDNTEGKQVIEPVQVEEEAPKINGFTLLSSKQLSKYRQLATDETFKGYEDPLRLTLAKEDNRPKISLWGVLKSLVGKDMTKMTLPVTFNEPTSLLQRNAEVIEYSELLDKAASFEESTLRMVYVAAFAASEYVSTVGRIAKPFNPLLGETYEYARSDKGYRCFVEQVSHHPPISALLAEAPSWSYYGASHVKTKFLGRSFDIRHLGTWFCELYPSHGVIDRKGRKQDTEVYSWKKVNNSVIGIIVGNPQIDNYGEMEIRNHVTGDYMHFAFKQRGWRASTACELKGEVFSNDGQLKYTVGGHWNSKIYAKKADEEHSQKFLIWEANPKTEMMFHLTNFAATLNAPQPHLLPVLPCTDTRLRPDQRAMENGQYDLAASEKNRVEEKQRDAKRQRDAKGTPYKPSFFYKSTHPVTGDEYFQYNGNYWNYRKEGKLRNYKDIF